MKTKQKITKYDLEKFIYNNQTKMIKINDTTNREYKRLKLINQLTLMKLSRLIEIGFSIDNL
jgi:hypothetical protein